MKKALISGITGQDGSFLAEFLLQKGYEVHGILRRSSSFNTGRIEHLYFDEWVRDMKQKRTINLHYGDMTDSSSLIRIIQSVQPDEIYNLAAQSHVKVSFDVPEYTAETDAVGTLRMLEAVRILGMEKKTRIYQASTSELFGKVQEVPQSETTPFYPRSPYGVAKQYCFWITKNVTDQHTLYAYYPYTNTATDTYTVPNVSIKPDQNNSSTAADYEASDLLWGKCTTVATNNASISMKHCMSQITVTLSAGNGYSSLPAIDKVELLCSAGFALSGTWNLADGKVTKANDAAATDAAAASTTSITTYAHSVAGATTYRAIVLPGQAFTNSSQFVKVTSGSNTYTYYLAMSSSENLTTEANKTYNFDLSLNKAGLTLKGITIAAWDTDEIEGDAGMDIGN